ncbi:MAG: glycerophosphodiester phosphodiesterase family protein [Thermodesulfobacteriota bacterium]|nr:glycerophosphodiester phosphodiesterase family protein [Thermodesulfobacteriota bacterium]
MQNKMMIMGHRGAAALEPENTLLSISRAMEIGVDAVEIDVHLSRDNEVVVIHDSTVDRTSNGSGPVCTYTLADLKKLDAGKGETIPTLQEVVDLIDKRVKLVIELKEEGAEGQVVTLINENNLVDNVYVISFWHKLVKRVKELEEGIKTGVLLVGCPVDTSVATQASADALVMRYTFVDKPFVEMAHKEGLKVFIWNIDDPTLVKPYAHMGVDGIGSNDPRVLVDYFR